MRNVPNATKHVHAPLVDQLSTFELDLELLFIVEGRETHSLPHSLLVEAQKKAQSCRRSLNPKTLNPKP
jgi:hypothetical protein